VVWLMIPAGPPTSATVTQLTGLLETGDIVVDGGNSNFRDSQRHAATLAEHGIEFIDCGTSGGVWGYANGYCLMMGGSDAAVAALAPAFETLAPPDGWLHTGAVGSGHFTKMVHNGIEYALMAAYAEGLNILAHADAGTRERTTDAETSPLRDPEHFQYKFALPEIAELWRRGSVIGSWLLDLTAGALAEHPDLRPFAGRVSDSGEGRWTAHAAIESSAPAPVLTTALFQRFSSRGEDDVANRLLSAMRYQFGGHVERSGEK
jgi:6-phosphogluconate dehydrogenase